MSKNEKLLVELIAYCQAHPEQRFWQAVRNWANVSHLFIGELDMKTLKPINLKDTYYFEEKLS